VLLIGDAEESRIIKERPREVEGKNVLVSYSTKAMGFFQSVLGKAPARLQVAQVSLPDGRGSVWQPRRQ
jgi:hypothetical protein